MRVLAVVVWLGVAAISQQLEAALIVSIGSTPLRPNATGQKLPVFLRSDSGSLDVVGMDMFAFIGDGTTSQSAPRFDGTPGTLEAVEFSDGAGGQQFAWEGLANGFTQSGFAPEATNVYRSSPGVLANNPITDTVTIGTTETLVGQFLIDTTGFQDELFKFTITQSLGSSSQLYEAGTLNVVPFEFAGSFQVAAVPEPSALAMLGLIAAGAGARRMRMRKQRRPTG